MSATGRDLVSQGERFLKEANIADTNEVWEKLMELALAGTLDLTYRPKSRKDRARLLEQLGAKA